MDIENIVKNLDNVDLKLNFEIYKKLRLIINSFYNLQINDLKVKEEYSFLLNSLSSLSDIILNNQEKDIKNNLYVVELNESNIDFFIEKIITISDTESIKTFSELLFQVVKEKGKVEFPGWTFLLEDNDMQTKEKYYNLIQELIK